MSEGDRAGETGGDAGGATERVGGVCHALFVFDIGFQIDLERAQARMADSTPYRVVRLRRPSPSWFDYTPAPIRVRLETGSVELGTVATEPTVDLVVYDFGAALVSYRLVLPGTLSALPGLGAALYDNEALLRDATGHVRRMMEVMGEAIERPVLRDLVDDYQIYSITSWAEDADLASIVREHAQSLARTIEAEAGELSPGQVERSLEARLSYAPRDLAIVGWSGAILFDREPEDVIAVLQHANVELLELRVLDTELDDILDHADDTLGDLADRRWWPAFREDRLLRRFATVQTDAAVMFEGVNNAIKLLGNQYLARIYRMAAGRLDLPAWQASVQRKLAATESVYQKMSDISAGRRMETLEVIIILLIAISLVLPFLPIGWAH
jgi:hypothetical protein